jgi:hypothetical protein
VTGSKSTINTQDYLTAVHFVPSLKEIDNKSEDKSYSNGLQEVVRWHEGRRSYFGSPSKCWPSGREVLQQHQSPAKWVQGIIGKPSEGKCVDLYARISKLNQIYMHLEKTCPQHLKANMQGLLQHAMDMDKVRGKCSVSSWWDRVKTNQSSFESARDLRNLLPLGVRHKIVSAEQCERFTKLAADIIKAAKLGPDGCGSSSLEEGKDGKKRQVFQASKSWAALKQTITKEAGTGALAELSKLAKSQSFSGYFQLRLYIQKFDLLFILIS